MNPTAELEKPLEKRTWVYVQSPEVYGLPQCKLGHPNPQWSEFKGRLWCDQCQEDYIPEHNGVFDGPINVNVAGMLGMCFDRLNLETKTVEIFDIDRP